MFATLENLRIFQSCFFTGGTLPAAPRFHRKRCCKCCCSSRPTREKGIQKRPQAFLNPKFKMKFLNLWPKRTRRPFQIVPQCLAHRGSSLTKQKSGHSGGQAECPVFVFFASAVVPNTAGAAPEAAEQTVLPLPVEKRKEWRNGAERLQTLLFSGATWLELANHRCENRIPQSVSLVNPQFANFFAKLPCRRGFGGFSTFCPKNSLSTGRKPTCFLLLFKVVLAIIITQDFVGRFLFLSTPCSKGCRRRQFKTVSPPENRPDRAVFQRLIS